jgi:hypothetical protein
MLKAKAGFFPVEEIVNRFQKNVELIGLINANGCLKK